MDAARGVPCKTPFVRFSPAPTPTNLITIVGAALALGPGKCSYVADTV